jgi:hypothetical protein
VVQYSSRADDNEHSTLSALEAGFEMMTRMVRRLVQKDAYIHFVIIYVVAIVPFRASPSRLTIEKASWLGFTEI